MTLTPYDLQAEIDALPQGGVIVMPAGPLVLTGPVHIPATHQPLEIRGALPGTFGAFTGTTLHADKQDMPNAEAAIHVEGFAHTLRNFRLCPTGQVSTPYGILGECSYCKFDDITIDNFEGHGFYLRGANGPQAWGCLVTQCRSASNDDCGFATDGGSSGLHTFLNCDARQNGGAGFLESAFLQNTYIQCHTASNVRTSYEQRGLSGYPVFLACYAENDQPDAICESDEALAVGANLPNKWPKNTNRVGYASRLSFREEGHSVVVPTEVAPIHVSHEDDSGAWWRVMDRYRSNGAPSLKNCRVLARHKSDPKAPFAVTDVSHGLGPGYGVRGAPFTDSWFDSRWVEVVTVTQSDWDNRPPGDHLDVWCQTITRNALRDTSEGEPVVSFSVVSDLAVVGNPVPASVIACGKGAGEMSLDYTLRVEGPGTYRVHFSVERWMT